MKNAKKRTTSTVVLMIIFAIFILLFYYYWANRTEPLDTSGKKVSEEQALISKDLILYYPETPKEVVKLFAGMMKALYKDPSDEEVKALSLKIRELYDKEFLDNNPEDTYIVNLNKDLAKWKKEKRKITNYVIVNEDQDQESVIDNVKYATKFVSFTIQKNGKVTQIWKVLLRQNEKSRWKILGWEIVPDESSVN